MHDGWVRFVSVAIRRLRRRLAKTLFGLSLPLAGLGAALDGVVQRLFVSDPYERLIEGTPNTGPRVPETTAELLALGALALGIGAFVVWRRGQRARGAGEVRIEDGAVRIGGVRVPRETLREGWVAPVGETVEVTLHTDADEWTVEVADVAEGLELLEAVGLDARRRTVRLERLESEGRKAIGWLLVPSVLMFGVMLIWSWPVFAISELGTVALVLLAARALKTGPVEIGADGLRWQHQGKWRELKHGHIRRAWLDRTAKALKILRTDGWTEEIDLGDTDWAKAVAAAERLEEAMAIRPSAPVALLDRRGRTAAAWRKHLATVCGAADYRSARVPQRQVLDVLEDPSAPAARRVGAALALEAIAPEEARRRCAELAGSVVDPALAQAFRELAAGAVKDATLLALSERAAEDPARELGPTGKRLDAQPLDAQPLDARPGGSRRRVRVIETDGPDGLLDEAWEELDPGRRTRAATADVE